MAEGAGRYIDAELCRYFDISLGSLAEVVACADHIKDDGFISQALFDEIFLDAESIAKQLLGMKFDSLKNSRKYIPTRVMK